MIEDTFHGCVEFRLPIFKVNDIRINGGNIQILAVLSDTNEISACYSNRDIEIFKHTSSTAMTTDY